MFMWQDVGGHLSLSHVGQKNSAKLTASNRMQVNMQNWDKIKPNQKIYLAKGLTKNPDPVI